MFKKQGMFYTGRSKTNSSKSAFVRIAQTATGGIGVCSLSPVSICTLEYWLPANEIPTLRCTAW